LIGDNSITGGKFTAVNSAEDSGRYRAVDNGDVITVDLFGGEQGPIAKAGCVANFAMCCIEPLQHFGFIVGNVDAGNSLRENVTTDFERA
jgi:hypothetical protein